MHAFARSTVSKPAVAVLGLILSALPLAARAQHVAPMIPDSSFGIGGYAPIPSVDIATPGASPLGFVRLPLSGGYVMLSAQTVSGATRVVATRFTEAGAVDSAWGSGGSQTYAGVPVPKDAASVGGAQGRVVVNLEGAPAVEVIYLTGLYDDVNGRPNLMAVRLGADGALLSFGNSELFGFLGGAGSIDAVASAGGDALYKGHPGLLVAVRGKGSMIDTTTMVQVFTPVGTPNTQIVDYTTSDVRLNRPNLRINHLVSRGDGTFDAVGTEGGMALYLHYDAKHLAVMQERYFPLSCGTGFGASTASVADGIVRNGTATWLVGRAHCGGDGTRAVLARIADVENAPAETWSTRVSEALTGDTALLGPCFSCSAVTSDAVPGQILVTSPSGYLARVDAAAGSVRGRDALSLMIGAAGFGVLPTTMLGQSQASPWLTGVAMYYVPPSSPFFGLARIATDRVFADGMETWTPPVGGGS